MRLRLVAFTVGLVIAALARHLRVPPVEACRASASVAWRRPGEVRETIPSAPRVAQPKIADGAQAVHTASVPVMGQEQGTATEDDVIVEVIEGTAGNSKWSGGGVFSGVWEHEPP